MKYALTFAFCLLFAFTLSAQSSIISFDNDWRFHRGAAQGAEEPYFSDSGWRKINLPHDWSIEDLPGTLSPFDSTAISQVSGGFTTGGTSWYRKTFTMPADAANQHIIIQFDGVYMNADVWVNGKHQGNHPYGYTSFYYDITNDIKGGSPNIIAIEVKNEGQNSRWYSGSGIYRHVWLKIVAPVHIAQWGTFITTPRVSVTAARINIQTKLLNESTKNANVNIITRILNAAGTEIARADVKQDISAKDAIQSNENIDIKNPQLWSCEAPVMYKAVTEVYQDGKLTGSEETPFGIRTISFNVINGFQLNGKTVKLKGGCFHNDNGPLGSKAYDRAEERKVALLKASGYNAIRCSHNPPSPAFLNACDSLGILIMDEFADMWNYGKNPYDYHLYFKDWWQKDMQNMITRDRNHPSIIMWSIGNEIPERATAEGVQTAQMLAQFVKSLDTTRVVTSAVNGLNPDKDLYFAQLDVSGYNYAAGGDHNQSNIYLQDHQRLPQRIMVGTESYPLEAFDAWMAVEDDPYVIGDFVWTAWDYIGEASIGWLGYWQSANFYPWNLAFCGDIDICGWKRPQSFYRDALWKKDQLSFFVKPLQPSFPVNPDKEPWSKWNWDDVVADWTWRGYKDSVFEVNVYSSCDEVELFLNNKSLGKKLTNRSTKYMAVYNVPYTNGELKAVGYDNGKPIKTSILRTADDPAQIKLTADRTIIKADNEDLSYITVELVDKNGIRNPKAENLVHFEIEGPGTIVGVGNANPVSLESYQLPQRKAWQGRCLVIIKSESSTGNIVLKASSVGLPTATLEIQAK